MFLWGCFYGGVSFNVAVERSVGWQLRKKVCMTEKFVGTGAPIKGRSAVYGVSGELGGSPGPSKDLKTRIWTSHRCYRNAESTKYHETFFYVAAVRGVVCTESTRAALLRDGGCPGPYSSAK